jgi:signal peptidase I
LEEENIKQKDEEEKNEKNKSPFLTKNDLLWILIAVCTMVIIRIFIFDTAIVEGESMENTIHDDDRVAYLKITEPKRGKIAIVNTGEIVLIKRVIAIEGDTIKIEEGVVYLNGKVLEEKYIKEKQKPDNVEEMKLKKDEFYAMGDNRNNSSDSRVYGVFNEQLHFKGNVLFKFKFFNMFKSL